MTIRASITELLAEYQIPSAAIGVLHNGEVTEFAAGVKDVATGEPATTDTIYQCGSMTKTWTALALLQFVDEGKIDLDEPVRTYLPDFRVADQQTSAAVTPRHLLNHTSGLSTKTGRTFQGNGDISDAALEKTVRRLSGVELTAPVGKTHQYSTVNYAILGLIVQTVIRRRLLEGDWNSGNPGNSGNDIPLWGKLFACASLAVWTAVIFSGRFLAYTYVKLTTT